MLKILPPIWFFIFLIIASLLHIWVPATQVFNFNPESIGKVIGAVLIAFGMYLSLHASKLFKEANTEILPTSPANKALVTSGPYQLSRNPMYAGMVLSLLGIAFYIGTLPFFLAVIAQFCVLNFLFIPFEEQKMLRQFGDQYLAYKQSVRKWL